MSHYRAANTLQFSAQGKGESELSCHWNAPCRSIWMEQKGYKVVYCGEEKPLLNCLEDCLKLTMMGEAVRLLCPPFWWYKQSTRPPRSTECRKSKRMGIIKGEFQRKIVFWKAFLEWGEKIRYHFLKEKKWGGGGRRGHCRLPLSLHRKALPEPEEHCRWGAVMLQEEKVNPEHLRREWAFACFCFHHVVFVFSVQSIFYIKKREGLKIQPVLTQVVN